jgi:predicted flap endonuclease-1-like 5' DNA nuclease
MKKLVEIEGIGPKYAGTLEQAGLKSVDALLTAGATRKGRGELAAKTGVSGKLILRWVNMADLFRVKGVGEEFADLLEAAGVDTVVELGKRIPANLQKKMQEVNEAKKLVRRVPLVGEVEAWVKQAKELPRVVTY